MPRKRRKPKAEAGRFTAGELSSSSLSAMTAYAATLAQREERDVQVREIGKEGWLVLCSFDPNERATTITTARATPPGRKRGARVRNGVPAERR